MLIDRNADFHVLTDRTFIWKISVCVCLEGAGLEGPGWGWGYNSNGNWCSCLPQLTWLMEQFIGVSSGTEFQSLIAGLELAERATPAPGAVF